jgi:hypothetical protein
MVMKTDSPPGKRCVYVCTGNTARKDDEREQGRKRRLFVTTATSIEQVVDAVDMYPVQDVESATLIEEGRHRIKVM